MGRENIIFIIVFSILIFHFVRKKDIDMLIVHRIAVRIIMVFSTVNNKNKMN